MYPVFILHIHLYVQGSWVDDVWGQTLDEFLYCLHGFAWTKVALAPFQSQKGVVSDINPAVWQT